MQSQSRLTSVGDGDLLSSIRSVCRWGPGAPPRGWHLVSPCCICAWRTHEFLLLVGPCSSLRFAAPPHPPAPLACRSPGGLCPPREGEQESDRNWALTGCRDWDGHGCIVGEPSPCLQGAHCPVRETVQFNSVWRVAGAADRGWHRTSRGAGGAGLQGQGDFPKEEVM